MAQKIVDLATQIKLKVMDTAIIMDMTTTTKSMLTFVITLRIAQQNIKIPNRK